MSDIEWDSTRSDLSGWVGLSLVIDTNKYAGNFERELLAACTGVLGEYPTAGAEEMVKSYDGPNLDDLVSSIVNDPGDDGIARERATIYPTPGWSQGPRGGEPYRVTAARPFKHPAYLSVRIPVERVPTKDVLDGIKRRALAWASANRVKIENFRFVRERVETQSVDA